ncbi:yeast-form wall Protein 1 [Diutina catenulata]
MVSVRSLATVAAMVTAAIAEDFTCFYKGEELATADLETGTCPFPLDDSLPVNFNFNSPEDLVDAYYFQGDDKYWNDPIEEATRVINIPMKQIADNKLQGLFHVHLEQTPDANSTLALRRRLFKEEYPVKRDEISDLVDQVKGTEGEAVPEVDLSDLTAEPAAEVSPSETATGTETGSETGTGEGQETVTATNTLTTTETITSCDDNACHTKTQTLTGCETTEDGHVTTVWKPQTTVIIIDENCGCHRPATEGTVTKTQDGHVVTIVTWVPVPSQEVITKTICYQEKCEEHLVPATSGPVTKTKDGQVVTVTELCPIETEEPQPEPESPVTVTVCVQDECKPSPAPGKPTETVVQEGEQEITKTTTVPIIVTKNPEVTTPPPAHTTIVPTQAPAPAPAPTQAPAPAPAPEQPNPTLANESKVPAPAPTLATSPCETCVPEVTAAPAPTIAPIENAAGALKAGKYLAALAVVAPFFL